MAAKRIEVVMVREKETVGTIRYKEEAVPPKLGLLYVKKATVEELGNPEVLIVKLEVK